MALVVKHRHRSIYYMALVVKHTQVYILYGISCKTNMFIVCMALAVKHRYMSIDYTWP